ncbi:phosphoribosylglycinamide formyltransferase [Lignipirellula cremea]|uniref:Phosphoribosylglycinamide formyltransferase n=1 Tax=Lignipirellula cremea TaxID=2528010 RepID=A0A518DV42_9BACT|nr:phosphoribosylglycinamide formyltransferase [Lignipirellula cremea]QDU95712.1 Phosphoribosylglycinamide formyltransferase [Lignipirellula cremea]
MTISLAVLISGGGTTLKNLLDKAAVGQLAARISLVISSKPSARGLQYAAAAGVPSLVIERKAFANDDAFGERVFDACRTAGVDLAAMGGFLKRAPVPDDFAGRVMNIHPSLIPGFCGHGFYGEKVHQAVIDQGVKLSGCTVHFVDNIYDNGPIILQEAAPVLFDDTPARLAERVFQLECEAYPRAINLFAAGRLQIVGRRVRVLGAEG